MLPNRRSIHWWLPRPTATSRGPVILISQRRGIGTISEGIAGIVMGIGWTASRVRRRQRAVHPPKMLESRSLLFGRGSRSPLNLTLARKLIELGTRWTRLEQDLLQRWTPGNREIRVISCCRLTFAYLPCVIAVIQGTIQYINISCMCNIYCIPLFWTLRVVLLVQLQCDTGVVSMSSKYDWVIASIGLACPCHSPACAASGAVASAGPCVTS